jgi:hypothetical protein
LQRAVHGIVARKPQDGTIACKHEGAGIGDVERTVKTTPLLETANGTVPDGIPRRALARRAWVGFRHEDVKPSVGRRGVLVRQL